ncbi:MOSC domain-containing protein [Seonamhaeicola algicola]|uniref:MOSC domain-containing protein n=2 Tax=Seonamhaeicola TaxID=1649495 RepID=A0A5C7AWW9_9FLAO|nr:MOSC domain-containing protein [Seonamhaeicola algicola]TXE12079.1 MOSC domain-containing protein [Seonamhaeicola algicola]
MKIIATNIAKPTTIIWNDKKITTGIYKKPTSTPIYLGKTDVKDDEVTDRKHHGGTFKACYLFSAEEYNYWKELYPNLDWNWGMFGENLTVEGLNEKTLVIGNIYKVGNALVQVTQPREPCFKFGVKFGTQDVLMQFINRGLPGTYIRVLQEGTVKVGDTFKLIETSKNNLTTAQFFNLLYQKNKDKKLVELAIKNTALPESKRNKLSKFIQKK